MALLIDSITEPHTFAARKYLEESIRLSPSSANSWSQLANVLIYDYLNRWNEAKQDADARNDLLRQAEEALQQAFALDPTIAMSHLADGFIRRAKGEHQAALNAYDRAITLDPNLALAYAQKANQLVLTGRAQEALPLVLKAIRLDPGPLHQAVYFWIAGRTEVAMRRYDEAIPWLQKSVKQRPTLWFTRAYLVSSLAHARRQDEATEALKDFDRALPGYNLARIQEIYSKEIPNNNQEFLKTLDELYEGLRLAGMK